jgi:hypothetical protein
MHRGRLIWLTRKYGGRSKGRAVKAVGFNDPSLSAQVEWWARRLLSAILTGIFCHLA